MNLASLASAFIVEMVSQAHWRISQNWDVSGPQNDASRSPCNLRYENQ